MELHIHIELDLGIHQPLFIAPQWGQWVYLVIRLGDEVIYLPYHWGLEYALREGRTFAYKEDALVCLYGKHYATV